MDCASTDNTVEILNRFPQVQWISEPDKGQSDAINKGFLRATGDLMGWLNADDYYLPGGLEAIAARPTNTPTPMSSMAIAYLSIAPGRLFARRSSMTSILPSSCISVATFPRPRRSFAGASSTQVYCSTAITAFAWTLNTSPVWPMRDANSTTCRGSSQPFAGMGATSASSKRTSAPRNAARCSADFGEHQYSPSTMKVSRRCTSGQARVAKGSQRKHRSRVSSAPDAWPRYPLAMWS